MKDFIAVAVMLGASFAFSGCTSTSIYEAKWGKEKPTYAHALLDNNEARNGIFIWKPDAAAAVSLAVYKKDANGNLIGPTKRKRVVEGVAIEDLVYLYEQKACVMSSAAIKLRDSDGGLSLKVPASEVKGTAVELRAAARELQKFTLLSSKNEAATFLDVALFNICMASMNGYIEDPKIVKDLIMDAIEKAANIAVKVENTKQQVLNTNEEPEKPEKPEK